MFFAFLEQQEGQLGRLRTELGQIKVLGNEAGEVVRGRIE